jgi:hypothetical protein
MMGNADRAYSPYRSQHQQPAAAASLLASEPAAEVLPGPSAAPENPSCSTQDSSRDAAAAEGPAFSHTAHYATHEDVAARRPTSRFRALVEAQLAEWEKTNPDFMKRYELRKQLLDAMENGKAGAEVDRLCLAFDVMMAAGSELNARERGYLP